MAVGCRGAECFESKVLVKGGKGKEELGVSSFVGLDQFTIITRRS